MARSKGGGHPRGPIPPGGVVLGKGQQMPVTTHQTVFRSCRTELNVLANDEGKCSGYSLVIVDPLERRSYIYVFDQDGRDGFLSFLQQLPDVGTSVGESNVADLQIVKDDA